MKNKWLILMVGATLSISACSKKKVDDNLPTAENADLNATGDSDSGKAMGLQSVHFAYDVFTLDSEAKEILKADAQILKDKRSAKVQVEGHCDAHGGIQYNIALGEKRANAVKHFLHSAGVANDRISVISFGKEKLLDHADSPEADAKNRRANFVVTSH